MNSITPIINNTIDQVVYSINNLLITTFKENNVTIYGTWDKPLFKASDIGELLDIKEIRSSIRNLPAHNKTKLPFRDNLGRVQDTYFLTEIGLYKILFRSSKPVAEEFQEFVANMLQQYRMEMMQKVIQEYENKLQLAIKSDETRCQELKYARIEKMHENTCKKESTERIKMHNQELKLERLEAETQQLQLKMELKQLQSAPPGYTEELPETEKLRQQVYKWCDTHLVYSTNSICKLPELHLEYFKDKPSPNNRQKGHVKILVEDYIKQHFPKVKHKASSSSKDGKTYNGWNKVMLIVDKLEETSENVVTIVAT